MAELIRCKLLHALDTLVVQELHVVAGVAIEEVVRTHTQPEQMQFLVGIVRFIVDIGNVGRCERTVRAQIRELVKISQSVKQRLVAATRETTDGATVAVVLGTIVLLDIRHQVVDEVLAKHIAAKACLRRRSLGTSLRCCIRSIGEFQL